MYNKSYFSFLLINNQEFLMILVTKIIGLKKNLSLNEIM